MVTQLQLVRGPFLSVFGSLQRLAGALALTLGLTLVAFGAAEATALKFSNDTDSHWRVRVDGGPWQHFPPQPAHCKCSGDPRNYCPGWGDIARKVKDSVYYVDFEVWTGDGYNHVFRANMQGNFYTNVAQIRHVGPQFELSFWWEFGRDGKCRDKPPLAGCRNSCLVSHEEYRARREQSRREREREPRGADR